jgi:hypothetical protein
MRAHYSTYYNASREEQVLETFLRRAQPSIGVVYGRRRIGKSLLLRHALEGRPSLLFEGLENRPKREQIKAFVFELARQTGVAPRAGAIRTWREALTLLEPALRKAPACVVLDEFQCMAHARQLARILGFPGVEFSSGPYFRAPTRDTTGLQVDLLFARADNVLTVCEMKCSVAPLGMDVVREVERKVELLRRAFPSKTIQRVLVIQGEPSRAVVASGYFHRIVRAEELAANE